MTSLASLVETSSTVAETSARLGKIAAVAECLARLLPEEIAIAVPFLSGAIRQERLGVGYAMVGSVRVKPAETARLSIVDVDEVLARIQGVSGSGSRETRMTLLMDLLGRATAAEQRFMRRVLVGEVRQGAQGGIMIEAIARAGGVATSSVRRAMMLRGDLGVVASAALAGGEAALAGLGLELFRPLQPMLAQTAEDVEAALGRTLAQSSDDEGGSASLEWKLDGVRIQVHAHGDEVRVFTRRLNEVTASVPEIVEAFQRLDLPPVVFDGEALVMLEDGTPRPFQVTMRRFGRRLDIERSRRELPISPFFFDCLHHDGSDLIDRPAHERHEILRAVLGPSLVVPRVITADPVEAAAFMRQALEAGHEGVLVKSSDAPYAAGRRGSGWIKVKPVRTLDLVVLAAEWGSGRRRGWLSNLHLGARDPITQRFVMLGKTFKGMTDETLAWQTERLQAIEASREGHVVHVRPELVVEIAFDGVQASPQYPGGVALRFARLKAYRPDKTADEADTIDTVCSYLVEDGSDDGSTGLLFT